MPFDLANAFDKQAASNGPDNAGASFPQLPIRIEKNTGLPFYAIGIVLIFALLPSAGLLARHTPLFTALLHSDTPYVMGFMFLLLVPLYFVLRNSSTLEITVQGLHLTDKTGQWFYNWADIQGMDTVKSGVRLRLRGRSDEQNQYNLISSRFGLTLSRLSELAAGVTSRPSFVPAAAKTVAPGDDLRWARTRARNITLLIMGICSASMFAFLASITVPDILRVLDLQKHGAAAQAAVTRIYEADCGKRGCSIYAEYRFAVPGRIGWQTGFGVIGSSNSRNNPNLVSAQTYRVIPIAYDVTNPSISQPNFGNRVFTRDPVADMLPVFVIIAGVTLVVPGLIFVILWLFRRQSNDSE